MGLIQIQLIESNEGYLNIDKGSNFPVTFAVSDIRDISNRQGNGSKSVKLAGDKNNNILLNNYFDVNVVELTFNKYQVQKCIVLEDGVIILDNVYLQLVGVDKVQTTDKNDQRVNYTVVIKDSTADFFTVLDNSELTDINLESINTEHLYTASNVIDSFSHSVTDVYKYVMPLPANNFANTYDLIEFKPGIYAQQYWDKIHSNAGFQYEWSGLTSSAIRFDKLIVPYNGGIDELSDEDLNELTVIAENTTPTEYTYAQAANGTSILFQEDMDIPTEIQDDQGYYDPGISRYTNGLSLSPPNGLEFKFQLDWEFILRNQTGGNISLTTGGEYRFNVRIWKNGGTPIDIPIWANYTSIPLGTVIPAGDTIYSSGTDTTISVILSNLNVGDTFDFRILFQQVGINKWSGRMDPTLNIETLEMTVTPKLDQLAYSFPVNINSYIPKKIKQRDFIKSITTLYNLYVDVDKFDSNKLIYKTRDNFYDDGKENDWSNKLMKDRTQNLKFLPDLNSKKIKLTYKDDSTDEALEAYKTQTDETYGQVEFTFDSEHTKGVDTKELIFSPTVIVDANNFNAVTPFINGAAPGNNIRLLYDGGMFPCDPWAIRNYPGNSVVLPNIYPLFSHFDSPKDNITFDINFGQCDFYSLSNVTLTNNNMFNLHWRRTMNQINTSDMLTAYFDLDAADIEYMELSDRIRIDNSWWNINKIIDYNASKTGPTKVELLSIDDDTNTFVPFQESNNVVGNSGIYTPPIINLTNDIRNVFNVYEGTPGVNYGSGNVYRQYVTGGIYQGDYNIVESNSLILDSDYNTVRLGSNNVNIIGGTGGNYIEGDNIYMFGSGGLTATQSSSDTLILGNKFNVNIKTGDTYIDGDKLDLIWFDVAGDVQLGSRYPTANVLPNINGKADLGSAALQWKDTYSNRFYINGTNSTVYENGTDSLFIYNVNLSGTASSIQLLDGEVTIDAEKTFTNDTFRNSTHSVQTVNNTTTTINTYLPTSDGIYSVDSICTGYDSASTDSISSKQFAAFKVVSGVVTQVSTTSTDRKSDFPASVLTLLNTDGTVIRMQVKGKGGTTIDWVGYSDMKK